MWGADLFGQVSQGDFLVREPVNPDPVRACIAASDLTDFGTSLMTAKGKSAVRLQGVATPWFRCGGARGGAVRRSILADTIRCHAGHPWCGPPARWCAGQRGPCGVGVRRRVRRRAARVGTCGSLVLAELLAAMASRDWVHAGCSSAHLVVWGSSEGLFVRLR